MEVTQLQVRMRVEHLNWLRRPGVNASSEIRQAIQAYITYLSHGESKTKAGSPVGYHEVAQNLIEHDIGPKERYNIRLWSHQTEWLLNMKGQAGEYGQKAHRALRRALDIYITWRDFGFKATIKNGVPRVSMGMYTVRLRVDQIEWLNSDELRVSQEKANKPLSKARKPLEWTVSGFIRDILSVYFSHNRDLNYGYEDALKLCKNTSPGTVAYSLYIENRMHRHIHSVKKNASAEIRLAIDAYREWMFPEIPRKMDAHLPTALQGPHTDSGKYW